MGALRWISMLTWTLVCTVNCGAILGTSTAVGFKVGDYCLNLQFLLQAWSSVLAYKSNFRYKVVAGISWRSICNILRLCVTRNSWPAVFRRNVQAESPILENPGVKWSHTVIKAAALDILLYKEMKCWYCGAVLVNNRIKRILVHWRCCRGVQQGEFRWYKTLDMHFWFCQHHKHGRHSKNRCE